MFTEIYIEALLVDAVLADQVWELWHAGLISDEFAALAWWFVGTSDAVERTASNRVVLN